MRNLLAAAKAAQFRGDYMEIELFFTVDDLDEVDLVVDTPETAEEY